MRRATAGAALAAPDEFPCETRMRATRGTVEGSLRPYAKLWMTTGTTHGGDARPMATTDLTFERAGQGWVSAGVLVFALAVAAAAWFFAPGLGYLAGVWQMPEYSHGPLIPVISAFLFLRHLRDVPVRPGAIPGRWPGVVVVALSLLVGAVGRLTGILDFVAYGLVLWVAGVLLISFGWRTGVTFWTAVLHLVYMLPLPGVIHYKMTAWLQLVSSEIGVAFLRMMDVTVFRDGNIIDFGDLQVHVAEACSGLAYLFPILSFSYVFAILYTGPLWHRIVILLAAAPITVLMNAVRIAVAGLIVQHWGADWLDGFTHFFEGWVIFLAAVALLFAIARAMMVLHAGRAGLTREALDLDFSGLGPQAGRLRLIRPSPALVTAALLPALAASAFAAMPDRGGGEIDRTPFALFPRALGEWRASIPKAYPPAVVESLGADDYHWVDLTAPGHAAPVDFFVAWYADQSDGGVHSPEICLPGSGWEIASLERVDIAAEVGWPEPFMINRAVIQKGMTRQLVWYWFDQRGRKVAWDFAAKAWLVWDGVKTGRTDGALMRLTTPLARGETAAQAAPRLRSALTATLPELRRFVPDGTE